MSAIQHTPQPASLSVGSDHKRGYVVIQLFDSALTLTVDQARDLARHVREQANAIERGWRKPGMQLLRPQTRPGRRPVGRRIDRRRDQIRDSIAAAHDKAAPAAGDGVA